MQSTHLLLPQESPTSLGVRGKDSRVKLMLRNEITFTSLAAQEVRLDRVTEAKRGPGALLAEQDHVGEVGVLVGFDGCLFAEDTA